MGDVTLCDGRDVSTAVARFGNTQALMWPATVTGNSGWDKGTKMRQKNNGLVVQVVRALVDSPRSQVQLLFMQFFFYILVSTQIR
jgi:hypothetical protein